MEKDHSVIHLGLTQDMAHLLDQKDKEVLVVPDPTLEDLVVLTLDKEDLVVQTLDKEDLVDQTQQTLVMVLLEVVLLETTL